MGLNLKILKKRPTMKNMMKKRPKIRKEREKEEKVQMIREKSIGRINLEKKVIMETKKRIRTKVKIIMKLYLSKKFKIFKNKIRQCKMTIKKMMLTKSNLEINLII